MILRLFRLIIKKYGFGRPPTKVGQKVILSARYPYTPNEEHPTEGTSYECGGIVEHIKRTRRTKGIACVKWCNDHVVKLSMEYLEVIPDEEFEAALRKGFVADNPNLTFKRREMEKAKRKEKVEEDVGYCMEGKYCVERQMEVHSFGQNTIVVDACAFGKPYRYKDE